MKSNTFTDNVFSTDAIFRHSAKKHELSQGQKSLWLKYKQFPESSAYNEGFAVRIHQSINLDDFRMAVKTLAQKHPLLRARFEQSKGNIYQFFDGNYDYFEFEDAFLWSEEYLNNHILETFNQPFNLEIGSVFRVAIYKLAFDEYILLLSAHHIVCDGWSVLKLLSNLFELVSSENKEIESIDNNYDVFVAQESENILTDRSESIKNYWQQRLAENIITLDLPKQKNTEPKGLLKQISNKITEKNYRKIELFAKENQVSVFVVLLSAYQILLGRYGRQNKVISGVPFLNRSSAKFADTIGFFVNTLPILNQIDNQQSFIDNISSLKSTTYDANKYQNFPFDKIYEAVLDYSHEKLEIENYFIFQSSSIHLDKVELLRSCNENLRFNFYGFELSPFNGLHQRENKLSIQMEVVKVSDGLKLFFQYDISTIENGIFDNFLNHYETLTLNLIANANKPINELSYLNFSEKQKLIEIGKGLQHDFDLNRSYAEQLYDVVKKHSNHVAVRHDDQVLTYSQLWEYSGRIMNLIRNNEDFAQNQIVGVRMNRGINWIVSIIGIFRAGGIYMPIDIDIPQQRIDWMLEDTKSKIILTDCSDILSNTYQISEILKTYQNPQEVKFYHNNYGEAYIIYTSGSTGKPKGAIVNEKGMLNHHHSRIEQLNIKTGSKVVQSASMSFDISMWQALAGLLVGAETVIIGKDDLLSPKDFWQKVASQEAHILQVVPTYLSELVNVLNGEIVQKLHHLKLVCTIGEVLQPDVVIRLKQKLPDLKIINMYGPTEASDTVCQHEIDEIQGAIPIGRPIENMQIYLMDESGNLTPNGIKGEIYIGGVGVGNGYINREEQTTKAFLKDTYTEGMMYRTGDIGRWNKEGLLEYHGRGDHQIKHRGYRIELGEIERLLKTENGVKQAVVIKKGENLIGFVCLGAEGVLGGILGIKERLSEKLPKYMLPNAIYEIESFPLTITGKIDRSKLIIPEKNNTIIDEVINETEEKVLEVFRKVLKTNQIHLSDNFFEVGGDSIRAMRAVALLADFGYDLDIKSVFETKNLALLAREVQQINPKQSSRIKITIEGKLALSEQQKTLWLQQQINPNSTAYNEGFAIRIHQKIDTDRLEKVIHQLIKNNPILQTRFEEIKGEVFQFIEPRQNNFEVIKCNNFSSEKLLQTIHNCYNQIFDLKKGDVFRVKIFMISENESVLLVSAHHIIFDGWSSVLILSEIIEKYSKNYTGNEIDTSYFDFISQQNKHIDTQQKVKYWQQKLSGKINPLDISCRKNAKKLDPQSFIKYLKPDLVNEIEKIAQSKNLSVAVVFLGCFQILLSRYGRQKNIITGIPVANRIKTNYENTIGNFVNTLPILTEVKETESIEELFQKLKNTLSEGLAHQDFSFNQIYDAILSDSQSSEKIVLESYFSFQASASEQETIHLLKSGEAQKVINYKNLLVSPYEDLHQKHSKFPIHLEVVHTNQSTKLHLKVNTEIFEDGIFNAFLGHFEFLLQEFLQKANKKVSEINHISENEKNAILELGKGKITNYDLGSYIKQLSSQVEKTPDAVAIRFGKEQITYHQLWSSAGNVASFLTQQRSFQNFKVVGVRMERSIEWLISLVGILRAGGTYLPIDIEIPRQRIDWMIEDTKSQIIITETRFQLSENSFDITEILKTNQEYILENNEQKNTIPYIIYTSGSTGKPKGAKVNEAGMLNHLHSRIKRFALKKGTRVAQSASMSFDISIWQSLAPLLVGGEVIIISRANVLSAKSFFNVLSQQKINIFQAVPTYLAELLTYLESESSIVALPYLTHLVSSAEVLQPSMINSWKKTYPKTKIFNMYGPTEASDIVVDFEVTEDTETEILPIGQPIENVEIYLLDASSNLVSRGVKAEICIGGVCVGDGYVSRPEQTEKSFVDNPFRPNEKMYRTGDIGRWNENNQLEYHGRADHQIKHKGYRIELGEIERQILDEKNIMQVVVVKREENLYAFITVNSLLTSNDLQRIRQNLSAKLPYYMLPTGIFVLENFPQTISGKIDRAKLKIPENHTIIEENIDENTKTILNIFEEILRQKELRLHQNFFEVGGDSIRAMRAVGLLSKSGFQIEANEIFTSQTFEEIIKKIEKNSAIIPSHKTITKTPTKPNFAVSPSQKRMWFMDKFENNNLAAFNSSQALVFNGTLNYENFKIAFSNLVKRHDILRANFITIDNEPRLTIKQEFDLEKNILHIDLTKNNDSVAKLKEIIEQESTKLFDLANDFLCRVVIISINPQQSIILFVIHHIISDGWSAALMVEEILKNYQAALQNNQSDAQPLNIQYQDYTEWLETQLRSEDLQKSREFWLQKFSNEIPTIQLPTDFVRPIFKTYKSQQISKILSTDLSYLIKEYAKNTQKSVFSVVFGAISTLLNRYTGQPEIIIGTPIAGRDHPQLQEQIGLYMNILPIKVSFGSDTFNSLVQKVSDEIYEAYQHQSYPFEKLIEELRLGRDTSRSPLFDVLVASEEFTTLKSSTLTNDLFSVEKYETGISPNKYDLSFYIQETNNQIEISIGYNIDLFRKEKVKNMLIHIENILENITQNDTQDISKLNYLSEKEYKELVLDFNDTIEPYSSSKTLHQLFEEQVLRTPFAEAIRKDNKSISYEALNNKSNFLANQLLKLGVKNGENVGLINKRTFDMIASMLAILKVGGAYVPIDPNYPSDRQKYIVENSKINTIIVEEGVLIDSVQADSNFSIVWSNNGFDETQQYPQIQIQKDSTELAYIIYTSGSSGLPKGVMIEHHSAVNLVEWVNKTYKLNTKTRLLCVTSMCFDLSVFDIFGTLAAGGSIILAEQDDLQNISKLKKLLIEEQITFWDSVPSTFDMLIGELENSKEGFIQNNLKTIFLSGDWIPVSLPIRYKRFFPNAEIISLGGATEGTVWSNYYPIKHHDAQWVSIPYGKPIANNFFYILDNNKMPVPKGIIGELYIGGVGVARGYFNDSLRTENAFMKDPFIKKLGAKMYKTGDLGRMMPDGNMEFLGRKDFQVKIRGYRVELGEIETNLLNIDEIEQTTVIAKTNADKTKYLVAFYTSNQELESSFIKKQISQKMPDYMIPSHFIRIEQMPLNTNGKIDRKALLAINYLDYIQKTNYEAPISLTEKQVAEVCEEIIGNGKISIKDNLFTVGLDSLKAIRINSKLNETFAASLEIRQIFSNPTIEQLASILSQKQEIISELEVIDF